MKRTYKKGTHTPSNSKTDSKLPLILKERPMQLLGVLQGLAQEAADMSKTKDMPNVYTFMKVIAILARVVMNILKRPKH